MWRLASKSRPSDVVLHDIQRIGEHIEIAGRQLRLRKQSRNNWLDLFPHSRGQIAQQSREHVARNRPLSARQGLVNAGLKAPTDQVPVQIDGNDQLSAKRAAD